MIYLGADHAGYALKEKIKGYLNRKKIAYNDLGTNSLESVDASDYAAMVAHSLRASDRGILICGSGIMMSMAANRIKGIRAALAFNPRIARQAREHNNANILVLSGRESSPKDWQKIVDTFLKTKFLNKEKYVRRLKKLEKIK
ncbi:MAG: RpiB/LacA/LacB family sugar-phosphate isomerase [Patescibacteria group bacterium]|jgi:ribose 5-phosphate isomerase B